MLSDSIKKVKNLIAANQSDLYVALVIFLVGIGSFGLGRLSVIWPEKQPLRVEYPPPTGKGTLNRQTNRAKVGIPTASSKQAAIIESGKGTYVASKNGSAYHFPWCPGAQKIKDANKIWFTTKEEAEAKGYKPAGNCPGL